MQKLGYIVTKSKIQNLPRYIGVVASVGECEDNKPKLIIGLKHAKEYSSEFSIINQRLDENTYWAFAKTEKRNMNERSLANFYQEVLDKSTSGIRYYYVNILCLGVDKAKKVMDMLNSDSTKHIYICDDMIYVFNGEYVLGFSLKLAKYCGLNPQKVVDRVKKGHNCHIRENGYNGGYAINKILLEKRYLTPFFMSLEV